MGPIKRKSGPTNDSFVSSKQSLGNGDRPSKRPRQEDSISQQPTLEKDAKTSVNFQHIPKIAKAKDEEAAFPRGGASILTPLEHKQIQIDATRDVLFEQKAAKAKAQEFEQDDATLQPGTSKKKKPKAKGKKGPANEQIEEEHVKIEGLSYKVCLLGGNIKHCTNTSKAHSTWVLGTRKGLPDQHPRHRLNVTKQSHWLCSNNVRVGDIDSKNRKARG